MDLESSVYKLEILCFSMFTYGFFLWKDLNLQELDACLNVTLSNDTSWQTNVESIWDHMEFTMCLVQLVFFTVNW